MVLPIDNWSLVAAVKEEDVLRGTLLKSPDIDHRCEVIALRGYASAAEAYNTGLSRAGNDLVVFAHTDVYFPKGWLESLQNAIQQLASVDPDWGVLGIYGATVSGHLAGYVYSTGLKSIVGQPFDTSIQAASLDEMLLIMRKSSALRFDTALRGFHLYGTDICLEAMSRGLKNYIIATFCIHNSVGIQRLPKAFWASYFYLRKKWWTRLPVRTCCTTITKTAWPVVQSLRTSLNRTLFPATVGARCADPAQLYRDLLNSGRVTAR